MSQNTRAEPSETGPGDDSELSRAQVRSEIQEYLHFQHLRRRLFPRAVLVGALAGGVAVLFRALLAGGDALRGRIITAAHAHPAFGWVFPVLFSAACAVAAVSLTRRFAPETSGSGIPHLEAVLHRLRELKWQRVLPVKLVGGTLGIGGGLALGREGPTVQMGGAVGAAVASWLQAGSRERLTLIAAGAGAGLAAAFNAPLAGVIFVLEEVQKDFRQAVFGAAFIAAATADIVTRLASGQLPVFHVPAYPVPSLAALPAFVLLGALAGGLGIVYNRTLVAMLNLFARVPSSRKWMSAAAVGAFVGMVGWLLPMAIGGGHPLAEQFLSGRAVLTAIPAWFLLRFALSMTSYATGAPGGIFAPLLVLGASLGLFVGLLTQHAFPALVPEPAAFAVVGMAAYFTAIVRAPLTGIVLILEMTGNYAQMLPLVVACFCAYALAEFAGDLPIYEALLERDLLRGGTTLHPTEPIVLELEVEPGAPFEGCRVRELGLPPGCLLVSCREGDREWVPTSDTVMEAHVRVTAVISPDSRRGLEAFRFGCEAAG